MSSSNTERALPEVLVAMPQMGVSVAEGTVAVWHKRAGDWVQKDEVICEISTDKIPARHIRTSTKSPPRGEALPSRAR